jgi:hypothetical protein
MPEGAFSRHSMRQGFNQPTRLRLLEQDADESQSRLDRHDITLFGADGRGGIVRDVTVLKVRVAIYGALGAFLGGLVVHFLP